MKSLFFGLIGTCAVVALSLTGDLSTYMQKHSLIIVLGGTFTLFFLATPGSVFPMLRRSFQLMFSKEEEFKNYSQELDQLARTRKLSSPSRNSLINYACDLWEQGINPNLFISLISQKRMELENETVDSVQAMKNIAKYPPALGMTGTVMGMIALFANLENAKSNVGENLALAMTATFFGLILTNALLSPLADRLQVRHVNRKRLLNNVYQILLLINSGEPAKLVTDEVEDRVA